MFFLNFHERFSDLVFARVGYVHGCSAKPKYAFVFFTIVFLHLVFIVLALNMKSKQRESAGAPSFKMIYLSPQKQSVELEVKAPIVEFTSTKAPVLPEIFIEEQSRKIAPLERLPASSINNSQVFDPKMRQKLIDAQAINKPRAIEKSGSWAESDGRDFVARGDGDCFVSMKQVDSRDRGKNWGGTRCGKTDSESMIDRVNADVDSRKNPPKTQ